MLICHVYHILAGAFTSPQLEFCEFEDDEVEGFPFIFIFIFITPCIWRDASVRALIGKDV